MSKAVGGIILVILVLAAVPFVLIARARATSSPKPAVHLILDMDKQAKFKPQRTSTYFEDNRTMRPEIPGVVAREDLSLHNEALTDPNALRMVGGRNEVLDLNTQADYERVLLGQEKDAGAGGAAGGKYHYVARIPVAVTPDFVRRGQERFMIYCAPCHGASGYGDGLVAKRAAELQAIGQAPGWVQPTNYHTALVRTQPDGQMFNTITNGIRSMPRYDKQISVMDRWAIVAYVRALQISQQGPTTAPAAPGK
jgi:mono/diheme cytochrome c family protein